MKEIGAKNWNPGSPRAGMRNPSAIIAKKYIYSKESSSVFRLGTGTKVRGLLYSQWSHQRRLVSVLRSGTTFEEDHD